MIEILKLFVIEILKLFAIEILRKVMRLNQRLEDDPSLSFHSLVRMIINDHFADADELESCENLLKFQ